MSDDIRGFRGGTRKRKPSPTPEVPAGFRELLAGATEEQVASRIRKYLEVEYGSEYAYVFWLIQLAAKGERETVRLDAITDLVELLHGKQTTAFMEPPKEKGKGHATPAEITPRERAASLLDVLHRVGAIPGAAAGR